MGVGLRDDARYKSSIAATAKNWLVAFQANTSKLWVANAYGYGWESDYGMMPGTSPSISGTLALTDSYRVAFQANTGNLWVVGDGHEEPTGYQMMPDTSPSFYAVDGDTWEAAFHGKNGNLWVVGYDNRGDTMLPMMPGTSPSLGYRLAPPATPVWQVAFHGADGRVWVFDRDGKRDVGAIRRNTSPSVYPLAKVKVD